MGVASSLFKQNKIVDLAFHTESHHQRGSTVSTAARINKLQWTDFFLCVLYWIIYLLIFVFVIHFCYVFKVYWDDPHNLVLYDEARDSYARCQTETINSFKILCKSQERWAKRWYFANILDEVFKEHEEHLKHTPVLRDLLGEWGHLQVIKFIEAVMTIFQIVANTMWLTVIACFLAAMMYMYLFYQHTILKTYEIIHRREQEREEATIRLNHRANRSLKGNHHHQHHDQGLLLTPPSFNSSEPYESSYSFSDSEINHNLSPLEREIGSL